MMKLSDRDAALTCQALRIASEHVLTVALECERIFPTSPLVERLRVDAEAFSDLRKQMEE